MSSQAELFNKTVTEQFNIFDRANPEVYKLFYSHVMDAITRGKKKTSSKMIINLIRWHYYLETNTNDQFKINDRYTSHYSRKFIRQHPEYSHIFEFRRMRKQ